MKQKTWMILSTLVSLSILIALITATIITGKRLYTKIGSLFIGILTIISAIPDIKKDGKLTWQSSLFVLTGLYFIVHPWL
ncbi:MULTISPECIES: hypothetical protein [Leuconostoc]|uniref:Uncharacterized protein n=1 Tax=Leuconostoc suionicum TaxID=1511761 RepID=A0A2N9KA83_9LACO|nr:MULTISPECIES: hypothetical protein [Leuconostoc]API71418.1 hypothetical protein A6B45_01530 [Leuconostoc suionicum]MBE4727917.1 hypothetical protein [Leuconostoc suionicum]MDI6497615.1 hypothetical protein [Leuconostoc suionicum]MDI6499687.1 hypothetical protein [Leuconostoc suionicum]MDI6501768.1 hypothetical protein [Leuconostoc suionicum]